MDNIFTIMTEDGIDLASRVASGNDKLILTKAIGSSNNLYNVDHDTLAKMTDLSPQNHHGTLTATQTDNVKYGNIDAEFFGTNLDTSYNLYTIGIFAKTDSTNEILYALICLKNPDYMDAGGNDSTVYETKVIVGNVANLQVTVDPSGVVTQSVLKDYVKHSELDEYATKQYVDNKVKDIDTSDYVKINEDNVINGSNKFQQDPVNKDGKPYVTKDVIGDLDTSDYVKINEDNVIQGNNRFNKIPIDKNGNHFVTEDEVVQVDTNNHVINPTVTFNDGQVLIGKYPVIPIVLVDSEVTAKNLSSQNPNIQFEWSEN